MKYRYCLITPAYNESENLDRLVESVNNQSVLPEAWIIVNDGSNDDTGSKIDDYAKLYRFIYSIHLLRDNVVSYYSRKIHAFYEGFKLLQTLNICYEFIGNLDADISMPRNYYENILNEFSNDNLLGVAGGEYRYPSGVQQPILYKNMVPGSILMFRRECFEEVGGYCPLKYGAEDTLACIIARKKGWKTRTFFEYPVIQHRIVGSAGGMRFYRSRFRQGLSEYDIGYHALFSFLKFCKRSIRERPIFLSAMFRFLGYMAGFFVINKRTVPEEIVCYIRKEQKTRMFKTVRR